MKNGLNPVVPAAWGANNLTVPGLAYPLHNPSAQTTDHQQEVPYGRRSGSERQRQK
jgi:hypothetical protein